MQARLIALQKQSPKAFEIAAGRAAIQFLTWVNTGSGKSSAKPPIRWGVLRGSSSAFLGRKLLLVFPQNVKPGAPEPITPATSCNEVDPSVTTWAWNTSYATRMHEGIYKPGPYSRQDGNAGRKFLEKHLQADKEDWLEFLCQEFAKELGTK